MNALNMKLESKEIDLEILGKCSENAEKKCKNKHNRKKLNLVNRDKEPTSNGLGCEHSPVSALDLKDLWTSHSRNTKKNRARKVPDHSKFITKSDKLQDRLQLSLSEETKKKVFTILNEIRLLSDVEKLFLYLQLPTGASLDEDPLKQKCPCNPLGKKAEEEGSLAVTWIQSHLEEDPDTSLPKQEVYDEYQAYCEVTGSEILCAADFGKVMKQIFPSVKPRRLGTRGNSRYCYSGLRKKLNAEPPSLPNLQIPKEDHENDHQDKPDEVMVATCHVLLEWAEKLLEMKFSSLKEIASYLVENMYVDNRSVAAFTLLLSSPERLEKASCSNVKVDNKIKKSDAHVHLQRKIHEKEQIKEQKRKLQYQRSCLTAAYAGKPVCSKKKNFKNRKIKLLSSQDIKEESTTDFPKSILETKEDISLNSSSSNSDSRIITESDDITLSVKNLEETNKCSSDSSLYQKNNNYPPIDTVTNQGPVPVDDICDNILVIDESPNRKTHTNLAISSVKTPVCVSQNLPGFIIVPSISQINIKDGKVNSKTPKYKRIQPKPLNEFSVTSVMRCRTGSLGSLTLKENKIRSEGRRSSLALLHSDYNKDYSDHGNYLNKPLESLTSSNVSNNVEGTISVNEKSNQKTANLKSCDIKNKKNVSVTELFNKNVLEVAKDKTSDNITTTLQVSQKHDEAVNMDDTGRSKRHIEDNDFEVASKKLHLDDLMSSDGSSESLSPWTKDISSMSCEVSSNFSQSTTNEDIIVTNNASEVSIHELETDALIDYLHGVEDASSNSINDQNLNTQLLLNDSQNKNLNHSDLLQSDVKKQVMNPEMSQLSRLRMLLEQNLPHSVIKPMRSTNELNTSKISSVVMHTNDLSLQQLELIKKNKRIIPSSDISDIFLKHNNPCFNNECHNSTTDVLSSTHVHSKSYLSNTSNLSSQFILDEELLNTVDEQITESNLQLNSKKIDEIGEPSEIISLSTNANANIINIEHSSTQTQIPSVPPSPNTRRRAFNFMPISPRHTPVPDTFCNRTLTCYSPISVQQQQRSTVSVGVGPSQPPSNSGSPFVSPRSTPIPPSRSRHSSGQSNYSASRHTPFQNVDSGVSSISSSPFISPQPTPIPVSRLRHNSSHGSCKTVTFSTVNNTLPSSVSHGPLRLRHSSGPGGPPVGFSLLSPRSAPLSPLVNETGLSSFTFPPANESRSRHNSGLSATPLSPVSEQVSTINNQIHDISVNFENSLITNDPFISDHSGKEMIGIDPRFKHTRQRHVSSSVIYNQMSLVTDPLASEVQHFLKNVSDSNYSRLDKNRSRSVPLHEMLPNVTNTNTSISSSEMLKNYSSTLSNKHGTNISMLVSNPSTSSVTLTSDSLILRCDKSLLQPLQNDWNNLDSTSDIDITSRKNLVELLEVPLGDDLQTTLEDLRDCDTDFSKFAQELEQELNHSNEEGI